MTEVSFHFNAPDKLGYACRLLRKGYLKGARMLVLVTPAALIELDEALWQKSTHDFLPHCTERDPSHVQAASPIRLCSAAPVMETEDWVLVNLCSDMPGGYQRFSRVIEVVTGDIHDRDQARLRWRQYQQAGINPQRHDLQRAPLA
jgi:DNA polymerase-3 subunit chi